MAIYLVEMALIGVLAGLIGATNSETGRKRFVVLTCLMLFFVSGFRAYTVGMDTLQYWNAYQTAWLEHSWYEAGFVWLMRALNQVSADPQFLLIFTSAFMTSCVGYAVYKIKCNPVLALFLYVSLLTYATYMNLMRQGLAAAIVVAALPWLASGKRVRFAAAVLVASLFHSTAIVLLALIPLMMLKPTKKVAVGYVAGAVLLALSPGFVWDFISSNFDKYSTYSTSTWAGGNALAAPIMTVMDVILCGVSYFLGKPAPGAGKEEEAVLFHGAMLQVAFQFLSCFINIFQRMTTFTSFFLALYVASRLKGRDSRLAFFVLYFIYAITAVFFVVIMVYRPQWHGVVPYAFCWQ